MNYNLRLFIPLAAFKPDGSSLGRFLLILLLITLALEIVCILAIKLSLLINRCWLVWMVSYP